jgi:anti-sigma factor RsiW
MRCDHARERIGAMLDGELSNGQRHSVAEHAESCPACARYRDELKDLSAKLAGARERAPQGLARRIQARLAVEQQSEMAEIVMEHEAPVSFAAKLAARTGGWAPALRQMAAMLVVCMVSVSGTWWHLQTVDNQQLITRDVLAAHVRSLIQDNTVQVVSNDQHNVKPWFAGRLEFTPVVKDLSTEGYQLVGGRLDYIDGKRVAVIVYKKRLHQINVFTWPSDDTDAVKIETVEGYNVASWSRGGMAFRAISDLNAGELRELPALL